MRSLVRNGYTSISGNRVLFLSATSRDAQVLTRVLEEGGIFCQICSSMENLCAECWHDVGALLIAEEALNLREEVLTDCLARQPVWSDIPVIVLSRSGVESATLTDMLPRLRNVSVLERPVRITTMISVVQSALRARMRQYQVREYFIEREKVETQLRASEQRLSMAVRTGKLGIWQLDMSTNELICSDTCRTQFGWPLDQPLDYGDFFDALHPDDRDRVERAASLGMTGDEPYDIEYRTVWSDGSIHWVLARGQVSCDENGVPVQFVGVTLDISERKDIEDRKAALLEAERAARAEVERTGQMKDEFLATLSHELRTPLNAILGWAQILSRGPANEATMRQGIDIIHRNGLVQAKIIEDLLDMNRIVSGKVRLEAQPVDLQELIRSAIETVQLAADAKEIEIKVHLESFAGTVSGDPNRLQQIFWNLLNNAVKFTRKNGVIEVRLERRAASVRITVMDSGEGIEPRFLAHVFDRFRQADSSTMRRHGGLGLGLAIVKQLAELHGGSVRAESDGIGKGAKFEVTLPLTRAQIRANRNEKRDGDSAKNVPLTVEHPGRIEGYRVLVVDDEADARMLCERILEESGAKVYSAGSVEESLEMLRMNAIDVLVSDIGMPGEDGYSLIKRIRALPDNNLANLPAIALTAYARESDSRASIDAGFQCHLTKPVNPVELVAAIIRVTVSATMNSTPRPTDGSITKRATVASPPHSGGGMAGTWSPIKP